jgi:hypothetical protein
LLYKIGDLLRSIARYYFGERASKFGRVHFDADEFAESRVDPVHHEDHLARRRSIDAQPASLPFARPTPIPASISHLDGYYYIS